MKYLDICSGLSAPSVAWKPLGMEPVMYSEIERFPREVLVARHGACDVKFGKHGIPLWGDFTALRVRHFRRLGIPMPDALVGGTPCQAFSIAGLRKSLSDDRGNLALSFVRLADAIDNVRTRERKQPLTVVWENVPGVLSVGDNAFGCFLAALVGADAPLVPTGRWTDAGLVIGPKRSAAWRIEDAQYFGLAQRRERVFVVASARGPAYTSEVLFESRGLHGNHPPRREERQSTTYDVAPSLTSSGRGVERAGESRGQDPVVPVYQGLRLPKSGDGASFGEQRMPNPQLEPEATSGVSNSFPELVGTLSIGAHGGGGLPGRTRTPDESLVAHALTSRMAKGGDPTTDNYLVTGGFFDVAHALRGDGFDASEDGTGRGTPLVVAPLTRNPYADNESRETLLVPMAFRACGQEGFTPSDITPPITSTDGGGSGVPTIAFTCKDYGADAGEIAPTLRSMGHDKSHANAGGQLAVAFDTTQITSVANRSNPQIGDPCHPLASQAHAPAIAFCERGRDDGRPLETQEELAYALTNPGSGGRTNSRQLMTPNMAVRRLTVVECARLQGFSDVFCHIETKSKRKIEPDEAEYLTSHGLRCELIAGQWFTNISADGPMYKALGNSMAVPVLAKIGRNILRANKIFSSAPVALPGDDW